MTTPPLPAPGEAVDTASLAGLIFDFDGVIVESADIKTAAFRALYRQYGEDIVAGALAHHQENGGISRRQKIRYCHRTLLGLHLSEAELEHLCLRFSELVEDAVVDAPPVPGAETLLAALAGAVPMFVVSGTPQAELSRIVARRGLNGHFVEVHGSPPEKPPIIRGILDRHRLPADRVLFIGDAMTDYRAAVETSLRFVGRVQAGNDNPFPEGVAVVADLTALTPLDPQARRTTGGRIDGE